MPKAACATNKTDFMRYMNEHPDVVPSLGRLAKLYQDSPSRRKNMFGFWLKMKHPVKFDLAYYSFWMRHPEFHGKVYEMAG